MEDPGERRPVLLTSGLKVDTSTVDAQADITSDGRTLVYVGSEGGRNRLQVVELNSGHARNLVETPEKLFTPRWRGPDDSTILYISNSGGQFDIWEFDLRRGISLPVTSSPMVEEALSPDNRWVGFLRWVTEPYAHARAWLYDVRTRGDPVQIADEFSDPPISLEDMSWASSNMTWSSTGDLYCVIVGPDGDDEIVRIRPETLDDTPPQTIVAGSGTTDGLFDLRPSPDGHLLAFVTMGPESWPGGRLRVVDTELGRTWTIASLPEGRRVGLLGWRADGSLVVLSFLPSNAAGTLSELSVVAADGKITTIATLPQTYPIGAIYDARRDTVYLSLFDGEAQGIGAYSLADRRLESLIEPSIPGVFFGGFEVVGDRSLLFFRKEDKADIWLLQLR